MEKLKIQLENCYGIKKLIEELDFSSKNSFAIYAPNGVMKTSFAKAFQDLSNEKESEDRIFRDRQTIRIVKNESDIAITKEKVFVIVPYSEEFKSEKLSTLLANKELKEEYDQIHKSINEKKEQLIRELKASSGLTKDIEETISDVFTHSPKDFFKAMGRLESEVIEGNTSEFENISYKKLFGDKQVVDFLKTPDFSNKLSEYTRIYDRLLSSSTYFKKGIFNHNNASVIAKNLKDNGFFKASHTVSLNAPGGRKEITTEQELETVIQQEKDVILENSDLAKSFEEIDSKLKANKELRDFRDYLNDNQNILPELSNLDGLKQKIWVSYLLKSVGAFKALMDEYSSRKKKIGEIINQAKLETTKWQKVINIFNERFSVPFVVDIENQEDVILKSEAPSIKFEFKDDDGITVIPVEEKYLWNVLSNGERRALYILNIIFEVEARKENQQETLFVIDDIADSFDYKNKYAIIEYLHEISQIENFYQIVLSHNFDFFRTICSRLSLKRSNRLHVVKSSISVRLTEEKYQNNPFADWKNNLDDDNKLIASIPFIRNLAEYCGFANNYNKLTSLLHMKNSTASITVEGLEVIIHEILQDKKDAALDGKDRKVKDLICSSADSILNENEEIIDLEKKIVLSIAIRLKAEVFLIQQINDQTFVEKITKNQTCALIEKYKEMFPDENQTIKLMERVNLMTPENIHLNSFMYEPILDMSNEHLKQLYQNICQLGSPLEVTAS